jgi:hypothetical protein
MWNGFYDIGFDTIDSLREFYIEALSLCDSSYVDIKRSGSFSRQRCDMLPIDYINNKLSLTTHNTVVNRYQYNGCADWVDKKCEIGSVTMVGDSYYLYLIFSIVVFDELVGKYKLVKKEF